MLQHSRCVTADRDLAGFAEALQAAQSFDLAKPAEALSACLRFADLAHLVELAEDNPLGWAFPAALGLDRLNGATDPAATCLGDLPDQDFAQNVLLATYLEAVAADQPLVHRIGAINNDTLLAYRRLTVPLCATPQTGRASHLLIFSQIDVAMPEMRAREEGCRRLSFRERQCLSLAAHGAAAKRMAAALGVSEKTVELHLAQARRKLRARTTAQAVAINCLMASLDGRFG